MAILSPVRLAVPTYPTLGEPRRGKVADVYTLTPELLGSLRTDGMSSRDFSVNALVRFSGVGLNALGYYWMREAERQLGIPNHLVAIGAAVDKYLPEELRGNSDILARMSVVQKLDMAPVEFVGSLCVAGSMTTALQKGRTEMCGQPLPVGAQDGDRLNAMFFRPTTKALEGHDIEMPADEVARNYPNETRLFRMLFMWTHGYAVQCGLVFPDGKAEFGRDPGGTLRLADEWGTVHGSRFWLLREWERSREAEKRSEVDPVY